MTTLALDITEYTKYHCTRVKINDTEICPIHLDFKDNGNVVIELSVDVVNLITENGIVIYDKEKMLDAISKIPKKIKKGC